MSQPYVAEIRAFPFNFAPRGWATCDGQLLPISQNTALFSLIGTYYGGDGKATFALPNFQGCVAIAAGQSPGTSNYAVGETVGSATVTLIEPEMPAHTHQVSADDTPLNATQTTPGNNVPSAPNGINLYGNSNAQQQMSPFMLIPSGSNFAHNNMMPTLTLNFCIALQGVYPPRS
ncbi:MAG TPA: tail fiber protein [Candidatus Baltobacteraceae bacterium]|nr:tail fiber protein [Candidatus Baltobacteraceae bacterium]